MCDMMIYFSCDKPPVKKDESPDFLGSISARGSMHGLSSRSRSSFNGVEFEANERSRLQAQECLSFENLHMTPSIFSNYIWPTLTVLKPLPTIETINQRLFSNLG